MLPNLSSLSALSFLKTRSTQKRTRRLRRNFEFEKLEPRNLLAGIYLDPVTGDLTLWGDDGANSGQVVVSGSQYQASIDSLSGTFAAADVNQVVFIGLGGNDVFRNGTSERGTLIGNGGNDTLRGGSGVDLVDGGAGDDVLFGGAGDDTLVGYDGDDEMNGEAGDDVLIGGDGANLMFGNDGDDLVFGGANVDTMDGGDGLDVLVGFGGDDIIETGLGGTDIPGNDPREDPRDIVFGLEGNDLITSGGGFDDIYAGDGDDVVVGGSGDTRIFGQKGNDKITGGSRVDYIDGGEGDDDISGGSGDDYILGGNDNDVLRGGSGADTIFGGWGDDSLYGEAGKDALDGQGGNDGLFGGIAETESLIGGSGNDRFLRYNNVDSAADFQDGDATINFVNSGSNWSDKEIEVIDIGLRQLHHRTDATLVFQDPVDERPMTLTKVAKGALGTNVDGLNSLAWTWTGFADGEIVSETYTRKIEIADWNESVEDENNVASLTVIHEIGHSFDSAFEIGKFVPSKASLWNSFLNLSGWESTNPGAGHTAGRGQTQEPFDRTFTGGQYVLNTRSWWYNNGAQFARNYGTVSPSEDWGTVWESLFVDAIVDNPHSAYATPVASKVAIVNSLLNSL